MAANLDAEYLPCFPSGIEGAQSLAMEILRLLGTGPQKPIMLWRGLSEDWNVTTREIERALDYLKSERLAKYIPGRKEGGWVAISPKHHSWQQPKSQKTLEALQ